MIDSDAIFGFSLTAKEGIFLFIAGIQVRFGIVGVTGAYFFLLDPLQESSLPGTANCGI